MPNKTGLRLVDVARNPANGFPARLLGGVVASFYDAVATAKGSLGGLGVGIFLGTVAWVFYVTNRRQPATVDR